MNRNGDIIPNKKMTEQQQHLSTQKPVPRFPDGEDLDQLEKLGWPMEAPETYQICVAGPDSKNPGRVYMKFGYLFAFWLDDPQHFDSTRYERELAKRQRQQQQFAQRELMMQDPEIRAILERRKQTQSPPQ